MASKPRKVKARQPRGFSDRGPADLRAQEKMLSIIKGVYERYGFEPVETPMFEYTDALGKFLPDSDRPNEGVFSLQDDDEEWLSLRYDLTAPLARYVAENFDDLPKPYRSYRAGYVFRNEKPGPGRFRQFMQFDADTVGSPGVAADAEMCMMMADVMEALGIPRGQYVIRVNNRKVLDGVLEAIGLGGDENAGRRLTVLRAIDKLDKFPWEEVAKLLGAGRRDESGDFTKGASLNGTQIYDVQRFLEFANRIAAAYFPDAARFLTPSPEIAEQQYDQVRQGLSSLGANNLTIEGIEELIAIHKICCTSGYVKLAYSEAPDRVRIDPSVVRGLEYYTGPVYEAELLFPVVNEKGDEVVFGSVGGGGRYDGLVARFRGEAVPATGFSIGVSRLITALKNLGRLETEERVGPVVVTVMDRDRLADYQRLTVLLRDGLNPKVDGQYVGDPVPVEMFQGNPKQFGKQLQYADRRNSPCVVIQGGDEKAAGKVQVKDLVEGKRLSEGVEDNAEWRAMRAGQDLVDEADMVARVKAILDARGSGRATASGRGE